MVIIGSKSGQLANRIFAFAHFIANAREFGYEVWNPSFYDYADYFETTRRDLLCRYPVRSTPWANNQGLRERLFKLVETIEGPGRLRRQLRRWCTILNIANTHDAQGQEYDLSAPAFTQQRLAKRALIVRGWTFRDSRSVVKHSEYLRQFFQPVAVHAQKVERFIASVREAGEVLVGVHVRQGDYAQWLAGQYYFDTTTYANLARTARELWPDKKVKFLICSNEAQDLNLFQAVECVNGLAHPLEDLYSLARCDYIIGPPSTFSMWASFYGKVPVYVVRAAPTTFSLKDFKTLVV